METVRTAEMSWRQVESAVKRGAAAIFPMGSTEEHGPHAPTGDYMYAEEIAVRAAQSTGDVVLPCLPFGYSEYFRHYPGTFTLQTDTLFRIVEDVVECAMEQGFQHILILCGHRGNEPTLYDLIRKIRRQKGLLVPVLAPLALALTPDLREELYGQEKIGHGGEPMGSVGAYLFPDLVDLSQAEEWGSKTFLGLRTAGPGGVIFEGCHVGLPLNMEDVTPPSGSLSNPMLATAERGKRIVDRSAERLARFVTWFKSIDPHVEPG